jgi:hypothetical protein
MFSHPETNNIFEIRCVATIFWRSVHFVFQLVLFLLLSDNKLDLFIRFANLIQNFILVSSTFECFLCSHSNDKCSLDGCVTANITTIQ